MCNRYKFIADIDNKSVKDFVNYAARLVRLYGIFGILGLINLISTFKHEDHIIRLLQILGLLLYCSIIVCCSNMQGKTAADPALRSSVVAAIGCLVTNSVNNLVMFVYILINYYTWTIFFSLLSIVIQVSTWYIFWYFKERIDKENAGGGINESLSPVASAPVVTPMAHAVPVPERAMDKV